MDLVPFFFPWSFKAQVLKVAVVFTLNLSEIFRKKINVKADDKKDKIWREKVEVATYSQLG
jgi:hypothetical protein